MIAEIKELQEKYQALSKTSEYVSTGAVVSDLYYLIQQCRLKRIPKEER